MFIGSSMLILAGIIVVTIILLAALVSRFLTTVDAGTIRLVSRFGGATQIYKGPGKAIEVPLLTTGTSIPSKAINIDLDIADQTADVDSSGTPRPIKVRVLASAIVSVGDSYPMITTAANKFFSKPPQEQTATLSDLLTSTGRRAVNLLNHDELFSTKTQRDTGAGGSPVSAVAQNPLAPAGQAPPRRPINDIARALDTVPVEEDDRLALIIKGACSRELQDLGLVFNSLNIKSVQSEVAEARRRQSAVEAKANADIVAADQERRAKEAQLSAEQAINDKQRELEQRRAQNIALIAEAEAKKQTALGIQREAELKATQIAQATADAERLRIQASVNADQLRIQSTAAADQLKIQSEAAANQLRIQAAAEADRIKIQSVADADRTRIQASAEAEKVRVQADAKAEAEAVMVRKVGLAQAEAIEAVNEAIAKGGQSYLALKQIELLPEIAPSIANALANAKMINISGGGEKGGAAGAATDQITGVIQTLLATQLVNSQLRFDTPTLAPAAVQANGYALPATPAPANGQSK